MVEVHHDEGVANRIDPESCADAREGLGEALTGERIGQPLSRESTLILGADVVPVTEGNTDGRDNASALRALALGAMPITAAVIGDLRMQAVLAAHDMAAESHGAATLDRRHHLQLAETDVTCIGLPPNRPHGAGGIPDFP